MFEKRKKRERKEREAQAQPRHTDKGNAKKINKKNQKRRMTSPLLLAGDVSINRQLQPSRKQGSGGRERQKKKKAR